MALRVSLVVVVGAVILPLAACGTNAGNGVARVSPSASGAATSSSPSTTALLVVVDPSPTESTPGTIRLFGLDGHEASHLTLESNTAVVGVAGKRVFVIDQNGKLSAIHRDGSFENLGNASAPFVSSPDGTRWLWATATWQGSTITSAIHLSGDGLSPRVVETVTEEQRSLRPYEWTPAGVFVEHGAVGIGGYIPFIAATGPVDKLDLETNTVKPVAGSGDTCGFSDMSRDGTIACLPAPHAVRIVYPDGRKTEIPLSTPRFNLTGDAYFSPDGRQLTVAGAVGSGADHPNGERFGIDLINVSDGAISRLSVDGVRPAEIMRAACWLPDGSLVVYRPDYSVDGPAVFLYGASGKSTPITTRGMPIGVLRA